MAFKLQFDLSEETTGAPTDICRVCTATRAEREAIGMRLHKVHDWKGGFICDSCNRTIYIESRRAEQAARKDCGERLDALRQGRVGQKPLRAH